MTMMSASMLAGELAGFARKRAERFVPTTIPDLFSDAEEFVTLPDTFLRLLATHRNDIRAIVDGWLAGDDPAAIKPTCPDPAGGAPFRHPIVEFLSDNTRRYLKNNNQFLRLSGENQRDLHALYTGFLRSFREMLGSGNDTRLGDDTAELLRNHRLRLREFVGSLDLDSGTIRGDGPHCSEYSPALQGDVLHLDTGRMLAPVLDLGCGEQAGLVRHLRREGIAAFGVDRFAPADEHYLFRGDWLNFPLGRDLWGTVISHMAFSHHFLHHHLKGSEMIRNYGVRYMEILGSLKPGGSFIYSPGLPFIENLLPHDRYRVRRSSVAMIPGNPFAAKIAGLLGESTLYSVHVQKIER